MADRPIIETRRDQMFPVLAASEIERLRHYGQVRRFNAGDLVTKAGEAGRGLTLILTGEVEIARPNHLGERTSIITIGPGAFLGELAHLRGSPALVDAIARSAGKALLIPPDRLRNLLIADAELGERIMRALILRRVGLLEFGDLGPVIVGQSENADVLRLQNFLRRNGHPHQTLDPETDPDAQALIERFEIDPGLLPIVLCPNGRLLRNPSETQLARCIGLIQPIDPSRVFDVAIVGAGPAGLAAAVYAGSEGLSTLILDSRAFGGQAGASSRIENYLGFPTGISGLALMARAYSQVQKFGVETVIPSEVSSLEIRKETGAGHYVLLLSAGERVQARTIVIATGARYRRLSIEGIETFEGTSVHYWASPIEANLCSGQEIVLVGAGNSAGQATVFLSPRVAKVWLLARGPSLSTTMSSYLVDRIATLPNVEVLTRTHITGLEGRNGMLETVRWRRAGSSEEVRRAIRHLFLFIGAEPNTNWLAGSQIELDRKGFVLTGRETGQDRESLETTCKNIFAIGDVRSGSVKRLASAVGEGAQVVNSLHGALSPIPPPETERP
jgi:thioredoxin reductase (NADPH)